MEYYGYQVYWGFLINQSTLSLKDQEREVTDLMPIVKDPEGNETSTLHAMVDFNNREVLEVGCGEGRLTWRYADKAARVTGIDPNAKSIEAARANTPEPLKGRADFFESKLEDFAASQSEHRFDIAIFAWSL